MPGDKTGVKSEETAEPMPTSPMFAGVGEPIGVAQNVLATDLVGENVEAEGRHRLRLAVEPQSAASAHDRRPADAGMGPVNKAPLSCYLSRRDNVR